MIRPYYQFAVLAMLLSGRVALSNPQDVQFDIRSLVGCKDVTSDEFSRLNPDEKLIEAEIPDQFISPAWEGFECGRTYVSHRKSFPTDGSD